MELNREALVGTKYGRLTIIKYEYDKTYSKGVRPYFLCRCECGREKVICYYSLKYGLTKSCGCLQVERNGVRTHGKSKTRLYRIYYDMKRRCRDKGRKAYKNYGGRGITVCEEWLNDFTAFEKWAMENGYREDLTIDRIDNSGNYDPDNCRWVDYETQANNTRVNHCITYKGETHTLSEWSAISGIEYSKLKHRIYDGWSLEEAFEDKPRQKHRKGEVLYEVNGEKHNIREWCRIRNLSVDTVRYRREHGWTPEEIFGFTERKEDEINS